MAEIPPGMTFTVPVRTRQDGPPVTPKDAATVMLLRDGSKGVEVFLLHRVDGMPFAGGVTVFPGGGVDRRDAEALVSWVGPPPSQWAEWFGCAEPLARALVCAAVRETFEESGVLLAGTDSAVIEDTTPYAPGRHALVSRELSLAEFLADANLTLRADLLRPWANWVTPTPEPRRYDARFFVATLPAGQHADGNTTEAESAGWQRPGEALADAREERRTLMLPTWVTLSELDEFASSAEVLAAERSIEKVTPTVVREGDKARVVVESS